MPLVLRSRQWRKKASSAPSDVSRRAWPTLPPKGPEMSGSPSAPGSLISRRAPPGTGCRICSPASPAKSSIVLPRSASASPASHRRSPPARSAESPSASITPSWLAPAKPSAFLAPSGTSTITTLPPALQRVVRRPIRERHPIHRTPRAGKTERPRRILRQIRLSPPVCQPLARSCASTAAPLGRRSKSPTRRSSKNITRITTHKIGLRPPSASSASASPTIC